MGPEQSYGYQTQPTQYQQEDPAARKKRIIIFGAIIVVFLTVVALILSALLAKPSIRPDLAKIAAQQNEIARVADLGVNSEDARRSTQNTAANVRAVTLSNLSLINGWANSKLTDKLSRASLESEMNEDTDQALIQAGSVNNYDEVFDEAMITLLTGANNEIISSFDVFVDHPDLQLILNTVGENNKALIDAISSE